MKHLSLSNRLLFTVSFVLTIFLGFSALSLDKAFRVSSDVAHKKQMKNYIYMLLTAADFAESGEIIMPSALAEPAFATPSSGLYAQIINKQNTVWQSSSLLGLSLALPTDTQPSEEKFTVIKHLTSDLNTWLMALSGKTAVVKSSNTPSMSQKISVPSCKKWPAFVVVYGIG